MLLRGAQAAAAAPWERVLRPVPSPSGNPAAPTALQATPPARSPAEPVPVAVPAPAAAEGEARSTDVGGDPYTGPERRAGDRRLRGTHRLGDVYAEQLEHLRELARQEGWATGHAAGHAAGLAAAAGVVAASEQAAQARLAEVQARWERRLATATAALGSAATQLEAAVAPVADELRESVLDAVLTLVGDMLGRELLMATAPGLDALRRALTLCPDDVPVVVRLHPDDLAEVPRAELHALPASVSVVGDPDVERAGAIATAGATRVDAQLTAALARVRAVLRG